MRSLLPYLDIDHSIDRVRFLYTRLLSLRPLLLMATKRNPNDTTHLSVPANLSSLDDDLVKSSCYLCINTAHHLIETIHQHLDTTYKSSGWHSVYCMALCVDDEYAQI